MDIPKKWPNQQKKKISILQFYQKNKKIKREYNYIKKKWTSRMEENINYNKI